MRLPLFAEPLAAAAYTLVLPAAAAASCHTVPSQVPLAVAEEACGEADTYGRGLAVVTVLAAVGAAPALGALAVVGTVLVLAAALGAAAVAGDREIRRRH